MLRTSWILEAYICVCNGRGEKEGGVIGLLRQDVTNQALQHRQEKHIPDEAFEHVISSIIITYRS